MIQEWWNGREKREKALLLLAGALSLTFGIWFGIISPLMEFRGEARRDLAQAVEDKALIDRALGSPSRTNVLSVGPAEDADAFRSEITREAQQRGLAISRLQSRADGTLQLFLNDVAPNEVYAWLEELATQPGGETVRASLTSRDDKVQVVIELQGTMP